MLSPNEAAQRMSEVPWPSAPGVDTRNEQHFGRPQKTKPPRTFHDELRHFTVTQSPYQGHVAPLLPQKRRPRPADVAEKRMLKTVVELDKIVAAGEQEDAGDAFKAELARRKRAKGKGRAKLRASGEIARIALSQTLTPHDTQNMQQQQQSSKSAHSTFNLGSSAMAGGGTSELSLDEDLDASVLAAWRTELDDVLVCVFP
jgi:hypothetical protein